MSGSWLWLGPALVVSLIWGVNQKKISLSLSVVLSLITKNNKSFKKRAFSLHCPGDRSHQGALLGCSFLGVLSQGRKSESLWDSYYKDINLIHGGSALLS